MTECRFPGCDHPAMCRGLCNTHYTQLKKARWDESALRQIGLKPSLEERFWSKVDKDGAIPAHAPHLGPCWQWTGAGSKSESDRYGRFSIAGVMLQAHRVAYEMEVGPVPTGLELDHLCRNTFCVRPSHLEPVTCRTNVLRGFGPSAVNAAKEACDHGHRFTPENTYREGRRRRCRACARDRQARYQARLRA